MIEINHLRYFYEVAKAGSFTAASRSLRISQSSISKAVALLEDMQGVQLFHRTKQGVALTNIGLEVYQRSQELFTIAQDIESLCLGRIESYKGPLKFGASDHTINYLITKTVVELKKLHPEITASIFSATPNEVLSLILSGEIEFGLVFSQINVPGIIYRPIVEVEMSLVCSVDLVSSSKNKLNLVDSRKVLKKYGLISSIGSQYQVHPSKSIIDMFGDTPNIAIEVSSQEAQKQICLEGGGVAFLADFMVEKEIKNNLLVSLKLDKPHKITLYLAQKKNHSLSRNAQAMLELFTKH